MVAERMWRLDPSGLHAHQAGQLWPAGGPQRCSRTPSGRGGDSWPRRRGLCEARTPCGPQGGRMLSFARMRGLHHGQNGHVITGC